MATPQPIENPQRSYEVFDKKHYLECTTESLNYSLRKVLKGRGAFPNDEAIVKLLYMGLQHVAKKWTQPIPEWKAALNQCVILFGERVPM
jgi:putative transposase